MTKRPRIITFILGIAGGLVAGAGALVTWRSLDAFGGVTTTRGTDALAGKIVLVLALSAILLTLFLRVKDTEQPRRKLMPLLFVVGALVTLIGVIGLLAPDVALSSSKQSDAEKIAKATGSTTEEVLSIMDKYAKESAGSGPAVTALGGLLILGAGFAGLSWSRAWKRAADEAAGADAAGEGVPADPPETDDSA